jgi:hypothetical protein
MNENIPDSRSGGAFDRGGMSAFVSLLRKGSQEYEFLLQGKSMGDAVPDGSRIRVRLTGNALFMVGQVLIYVAKDRMVVHRLVGTVKSGSIQYLITRGDAAVCCDLPVPASSVLGIVQEFSSTGAWQTVAPPVERWFGFRWMALMIYRVVGGLLRVSPSCAVWTAKRIIRIHGTVERATGFLRRRAAFRSRNGAAI